MTETPEDVFQNELNKRINLTWDNVFKANKKSLQEQAKEKKKKIEAIILKHKQEIKGIGYLLNQKCILRDILLEVDKWVIKNEIL